MSKLDAIRAYIRRTETAAGLEARYPFPADEAVAISRIADRVDGVALAFFYGRAKGYRAAKAEARRK